MSVPYGKNSFRPTQFFELIESLKIPVRKKAPNAIRVRMPTVFRKEGFRFFFYSNEMNEPPHVHVTKGEGEAKTWIDHEKGPSIAYFSGLKLKERRRAIELTHERIDTIQKAWDERRNKK